MSFWNRSDQRLVRAISTALTFTLVLLLTPCCEVVAALPDIGTPANTDTHDPHHTHHDDGGAPSSDEHCAPWLSQTFVPAGDAALLTSAPTGIDVAPPYPLPSLQFPRIASVAPHAGAPPPARAVYLLTSRLLL